MFTYITKFVLNWMDDCVVCGDILHELFDQRCHGFNQFWPINILNLSFLWFLKIISHDQKEYHMAKKHTTWSYGMLLHPTWHIPNDIACYMLPTILWGTREIPTSVLKVLWESSYAICTWCVMRFIPHDICTRGGMR